MDKVVCTRLDGSKVGYRKQCNATTTDAAGNMPPCAGMKECPNGTFGTGEKCSCGGVLFYSGNCITECTYEDTAESCAAKGQSFEQKCYGTKDEQQTWFGQCKQISPCKLEMLIGYKPYSLTTLVGAERCLMTPLHSAPDKSGVFCKECNKQKGSEFSEPFYFSEL